MRGERMTQEVRVHASRLEPGCVGEAPQDEECACAGERAPFGVQEEFRPVTLVEVWTPARFVAAQRIDRLPPDRNDALLRSFADRSDEPSFEIDRCTVEPDGLAHAKSSSVQQLDERPVAQSTWCRSGGGVDQ